jgi:hypothetical protein
MTRGVVCLAAALCGALLTATSTVTAAQPAHRFFVTIAGTQHFEWTLEGAGGCSFRGRGEQSETFGTARPVKVMAPPPGGGDRNILEFRAFSRGAWRRIVPLAGRETRAYRVLQAPSGRCEVRPEYRSDCRGTNPLVPGAGVVIMRGNIRPYRTIGLHVPVDTPWIARRPAVCNLSVFDLRDFYVMAVFGVHVYRPVRGGTFENRRAKTLRTTISVRYCVDPSESSDIHVALETKCEPPATRGLVLSGHLSASWTITFRRTR